MGMIFGRNMEKWEGVDWMHLAQDREQWQAVLYRVMNLYYYYYYYYY
jgi:hypothetical protein